MTILLFILSIVFGVIGPISMKGILISGYPFPELLFWRSALTLCLVAPFALKKSATKLIDPLSLIRIILGGTLLSLAAFAYKNLTATEVSLLSRLDLPIFILIYGQGKKRIAALLLVFIGVIYSTIPIKAGSFTAVSSIWIATVLTAISYGLIRRAAKQRSLVSLVAPPYFGAVIVGFSLCGGFPNFPPTAKLVPLLVAALCVLGLYITTAALFRRMRLGAAELTGPIALLISFPVESVLLGDSPPTVLVPASIVSIAIGSILIYWEDLPKWLKKYHYPKSPIREVSSQSERRLSS